MLLHLVVLFNCFGDQVSASLLRKVRDIWLHLNS
jgi:hypothetical protein